jgi:hypothetical protein
MILSATLSAALITFAGTAYANDRDGELLLPLVIAQSADGDTGSTLNAKPETPPDSIIGMDVVNADGETIGKVSKIADDQVIVSVGGFLGIGEHEVALPWSKFTTNGSGDNAKLEVALTKDELKEMPQYKNPE